MSEAAQDGDFVRVATCADPTEAHLLKGVLEAAGTQAMVMDANVVQANTWMTQALGGVRVMVPAAQARQATETLAQYRAGAFALEDGDSAPAKAAAETLARPIYSPDRVVLLSFFLTPVFGAATHLANALRIDGRNSVRDWAWLGLLGLATVGAIAFAHALARGPFVVFRASCLLAPVAVAWYFLAGQEQTRTVLARFGPKFARRHLLDVALLAGAVAFCIGWGLSLAR